jgi:hypothetical protein
MTRRASAERKPVASKAGGRSTVTAPVRFRVDPQLATLLGEGYRSSELALKELVDNAWDADATIVRITLPPPLSTDPIVIEDDGTGMVPMEVQEDYLLIARDRRSRKGERTAERQRLVKGRKGIGKFAGLMAADTMVLETRCRGSLTTLQIRKEDLRAGTGDLGTIDLPVRTEECDKSARGTTITLTGLHQGFDVPTPDRFKPLLMLEYGRQSDFTIMVNGEQLGVEDIPGQTLKEGAELPGVGRVQLHFTISDGRRSLRQSGIAVRVTGKVIGRPTTFGLEEDEEIPRKLLHRVYGELEADGLAGDVNAAWDSVFENSVGYRATVAWAAGVLKQAIASAFAREVNLAKARRAKEIQQRLAQLPEHRREQASRKVERVLSLHFGDKEERIDTSISVLFDALEQDEYWAVVKAVDSARRDEVGVFAAALDEFGLVDIAYMGHQAQQRHKVLDRLDELLSHPSTLEADIHRALEHNLWVFGAEYGVLASNKTLRGVIERLTATPYRGERPAERPDLLLASDVHQRHVLIEFKRPSVAITRAHEMQAVAYRDELRTVLDNIDIVLIGGQRDPALDPGYGDRRTTILSYAQVVSKARRELDWLMQALTSSPA